MEKEQDSGKRYDLTAPVPPAAHKKPEAMANRQAKLLEMQKKIAGELKAAFDKTEKDSKKFVDAIAKKYKKDLLGVVVVPPRPTKPGEPKPKSLNPEMFVILDIKKGKNLGEQIKNATPIFKDVIERSKKELKGIKVNPILLDEVWDACLKGHYDVLRLIVTGRIVSDSGWLVALKAAEMHKTKVLSRLDKYVVSYAVTGSLVRGDVGPESDLDVYIIIDDTDVTRMTSTELLYKLRSMIHSMAFEIESKLGIKNKIHLQVHVLTDVWNNIKNANPVVFTFLRDGVPIYDKGMYTPWKLLLKKGKVTPSPEAIDNYLKSGRIALDRVNVKLREIAMEDLHWATVTPTQGVLMLLGVPPVAPKEVSHKIREHLVRPKLLEEKYAKIWDDLFKLRKDIEHKKIKQIDPKMVTDYTNKAKEYLDRLEKLFADLEKSTVKEGLSTLYDRTMENAQAALKMVGTKAERKNVTTAVKQALVGKRLAPARYLDLVEKIVNLHKNPETTRQEVASLEFEQEKLCKEVFDLIKAEKGKNSEKYRITASYSGGNKHAAVWLFGGEAFILEDIAKSGAAIKKYKISGKGALQEPKKSTLKAVESKLSTYSGKPTEFTGETLKSLRSILANDIKLILG